jgi:hypothetical protein
MATRTCGARNGDNQPCKQSPLVDKEFCFWHDPGHAEEANEARRLGGQRRRRERIVQGAFEFVGLATVDDLRRVLEIATTDALGLENSVARVRALTAIVTVGSKLLETGEFEERLAQLESVLEPRAAKAGKGKR